MSDLAQGRIAQLHGRTSSPPRPADAGPPGPRRQPGPPDGPPPASPDGPPPASPDGPPPASPDGVPADATAVRTQPRKIEVAQAELVDALERLPAGTRMNVLFFNSDLEAFAPSMVPLDEPGRAGLIGFVKETAAAGSTALAPAMRTAFVMNARRIVLLSDGLGNVGGNAQTVLRDAREAMRGGVRIDTIGLGAGQDAELLGALASESGGLYQPL